MKAYKGFAPGIKSIMGNGIAEKCTFFPGQTMEEEGSKTARKGYHCCEYIFDCMGYYAMNGKNRFFLVEAGGNIDEDDRNRIACTRITLLKELTTCEIAYAGMEYILLHPDREGWEQQRPGVSVCRDRAEAKEQGHIAIARGQDPVVRGAKGSIIGLIKEDEAGKIVGARMLEVPEKLADCWLHIGGGGKVVQA